MVENYKQEDFERLKLEVETLWADPSNRPKTLIFFLDKYMDTQRKLCQ